MGGLFFISNVLTTSPFTLKSSNIKNVYFANQGGVFYSSSAKIYVSFKSYL
jgi:hypothetical protein